MKPSKKRYGFLEMCQNTSLMYLAAKISFKAFNFFISPWAVGFFIVVYEHIHI